MAYRMEYGVETKDDPPKRGHRRLFLTVFFFLLFLWGIWVSYPKGREVLRMLLIPGDPEVTLHAAEVFAQELGNGFCVADAARNFCITVLSHGYSG